jgi:hypothetical protein
MPFVTHTHTHTQIVAVTAAAAKPNIHGDLAVRFVEIDLEGSTHGGQAPFV